uniref:C3H1-type domain-containing protein n=1 Tax=Lutzomyia longipalpis TaxID=7200 RepID=A0A1B0CJE5_LUTLO
MGGRENGVKMKTRELRRSSKHHPEVRREHPAVIPLISCLSFRCHRQGRSKISKLVRKSWSFCRNPPQGTSLAEKFKSHGGAQVMEFCPHGTRAECVRAHAAEDEDSSSREEGSSKECNKLHFKKIIQAHTDESLGDCSFLNTCFHMDSCKYVHYEVDALDAVRPDAEPGRPMGIAKRTIDPAATMYPPQWIQCDLRYLDMTVLGKFAVIMADPPVGHPHGASLWHHVRR